MVDGLNKLEEHRINVQNHDVNMEALVRARDKFFQAYLTAHETGKTIDSKIILQVETLSEKQWVTIKELRSVNHG